MASILMVYRYTKTTEYTRFNFRTSILPYKKGLPYWWYTGIRRLQSIQNLIFKKIKHQFYPTKKGFQIDGIRVYEDYRYTSFYFRKLQTSILTYKKGLPYWWYTGIRTLPKYTKFIYKTKEINFNSQKGASILMVYGYTKTTKVYKIYLQN